MHFKSRNEAATGGPQKRWTAVAVVSVVSGDGGALVSVSLSESLDGEFGSSLQYTAHTLNTHAKHNYDETRWDDLQNEWLVSQSCSSGRCCTCVSVPSRTRKNRPAENATNILFLPLLLLILNRAKGVPPHFSVCPPSLCHSLIGPRSKMEKQEIKLEHDNNKKETRRGVVGLRLPLLLLTLSSPFYTFWRLLWVQWLGCAPVGWWEEEDQKEFNRKNWTTTTTAKRESSWRSWPRELLCFATEGNKEGMEKHLVNVLTDTKIPSPSKRALKGNSLKKRKTRPTSCSMPSATSFTT